MRSLENRIPPPLVAATLAVAMWALSLLTPAVNAADAWRVGISAVLLVAGAVFCLAGVASFRRAKTTVNPLKPETASSLVTSGIYQISRNPMYVGFAFFLLAWAAYLSSPAALAGVVAFVIYINRFQITPEERAMQVLFGGEFERYRQSVRRWL